MDLTRIDGTGALSIGAVRIEYVDHVAVHDGMDGEVVSIRRKQDTDILGRLDTGEGHVKLAVFPELGARIDHGSVKGH
jgi:hypothetical protein